MSETIAERYIRLGLRLGRHVEGIVDSYCGPPEIAAEVDSEPLRDPAALASDAEELLGELEDGWLRDQVHGLHTCASFMAGAPGSYADEVEGCYGVRPSHTDEAVFEAAHGELDELLPGEGPLAERYESWRHSLEVPADRIEATVGALIEEARAWARGVAELPEGERVDLEVVHDRAWRAFCEYQGGLRSQISVNADLPISAFELLHVTCHETYPGHHAERVCKDHLLVRDATCSRRRSCSCRPRSRSCRRESPSLGPSCSCRATAASGSWPCSRTPASSSTSTTRSRCGGHASRAGGRR